jgi:hypothetical protein
MKLNFTFRKSKPVIALGICGILLMLQPAMATAKGLTGGFPGIIHEKEKPAKKNKTKAAKTLTRLNNEAVKIYSDAIKREMHVITKGNDRKAMEFFVFDLEGTLVQHTKMQPREHYKVNGLKRGTYVYRLFCGDEEAAAGQFEIR